MDQSYFCIRLRSCYCFQPYNRRRLYQDVGINSLQIIIEKMGTVGNKFSTHQQFLNHFQYWQMRDLSFIVMQYYWLPFENSSFTPSWNTTIYNTFDCRCKLYHNSGINSLQIDNELLV